MNSAIPREYSPLNQPKLGSNGTMGNNYPDLDGRTVSASVTSAASIQDRLSAYRVALGGKNNPAKTDEKSAAAADDAVERAS